MRSERTNERVQTECGPDGPSGLTEEELHPCVHEPRTSDQEVRGTDTIDELSCQSPRLKIDPLEHLGLVHEVASTFHGGYELDDLLQVGYIGLLAAAERFDEMRGWRFSTYAYPVIRSYILKFVRKEARFFESHINEIVEHVYSDISYPDLTEEDLTLVHAVIDKNLYAYSNSIGVSAKKLRAKARRLLEKM